MYGVLWMYSLTDHVQAPSLLGGPDASRKCRCPVHHGGDDTLLLLRTVSGIRLLYT